MTPKAVAIPLVLAGLVAVLFALCRPTCPRDNGVAASTQSNPHETPQRGSDASNAGVLRRAQDAGPRALVIRRNLFAYVQVLATRSAAPPSRLAQRTPPPLTQVTATAAPMPAHEPDFPYRYIGRFGPEQNQFAVFAGNGDVVNARIGDWLAGQFRISAIGLESVEIASATGSIRRVSLQP